MRSAQERVSQRARGALAGCEGVESGYGRVVRREVSSMAQKRVQILVKVAVWVALWLGEGGEGGGWRVAYLFFVGDVLPVFACD